MRTLLFFLFMLACASNDSVVLSLDEAPFISVWEVADGRTVELALPREFDYDFTVDWGDGQASAVRAAADEETTHVYAQPGIYTVVIRGFLEALRSSASWVRQDIAGLFPCHSWVMSVGRT